MKKLLSVLVIVAIVATCVGVFAGCDNGPTEFRVGVLHINPVDSTSGYTYAHQQGIKYMQKELGLKDSQIVIKDSVNDQDPAQIKSKIEELLAEGCTMIIGTSFGYMDPMLEAAQANPEVIFSHGTGFKDNFGEGKANNMNNYFGRIYQARYLSGLVAGKKASVGGKIGYVSAQGTSIAECTSGVNAFALGVQAVNPTATVDVKVLNSWFDPTNETNYAKALLDDGCEVIAQHCDTENPPLQAKDAGKYSIGYNSDMKAAINSDSCLTSVVWNWGVYYKAAVEAAMKCYDAEGKFISMDAWKDFGNYYGSYADGLFGLSEFSSEVDNDTKAIVAAASEVLKTNKVGDTAWDVFDTNNILKFTKAEDGKYTVSLEAKKLQDNENKEIKEVTVANITGNMPYWIKGVTVK